MNKHKVVKVRRYKRSHSYRNAESLVAAIQRLCMHSEIGDVSGHPAEAAISVPVFHGKVDIVVYADRYLVTLYFYTEEREKINKVFEGVQHLIALADNFYFY